MVFQGSSAAISHTGKVRSSNQDSGYRLDIPPDDIDTPGKYAIGSGWTLSATEIEPGPPSSGAAART